MTYQNECFASPSHCFADNISDDESLAFTPCFVAPEGRTYLYGPTREIELVTYPGEGVQVTYCPTAHIVSWTWANRKHAFNWASERAEHMRAAGYRYS